MKELLKKIIAEEPVAAEEIRAGFEAILSPETRDSEIALFLTSLSTRGLDADVLTEAARVLREKMTPVRLKVAGAVDTCGTGGDRSGSFNFSTAAGLLVAACGVPVAKHGNRAITSKSGSADLLEALGIPIELGPEAVAEAIETKHFGFMLAPRYHPATQRVQQIRRQLDMVTVFNFLGPLLNPAKVKRQVVGVFAPGMRPILGEALRRRGAERAWVVSSDSGLDELSPSGPTYVTEVTPEGLEEKTVEPADAGLRASDPKFLAGKDAAHNAKLLRGIFDKSFFGPIRDGIVLNAAAALVVAGKAKDLKEAAVQAKDAIESGAAAEKLESLVQRP
ncbi:MAG: anthranilate phosphoribosyltransferase [Deltaproteobacteria bacterium]|nr:anthranilate phosphoribosyltransferase [Deltaproteobacteria bacterium]